MNLLDKLVNQALQTNPLLVPLRVVVEKELLHHDVLREMSEAGFLKQLTFMGGTCLRACYGSNRLSNDHKHSTATFSLLLEQRMQQLQVDLTLQADFEHEMRRFLPAEVAKRTVENPQFWLYLRNTVMEEAQGVLLFLQQGKANLTFQL